MVRGNSTCGGIDSYLKIIFNEFNEKKRSMEKTTHGNDGKVSEFSHISTLSFTNYS